jgi:hypothetical protein
MGLMGHVAGMRRCDVRIKYWLESLTNRWRTLVNTAVNLLNERIIGGERKKRYIDVCTFEGRIWASGD